MPSSYRSGSSTGQIKRVFRTLDEASNMHNEVLTIAGPYIKTTEEGRALIAHSYTERLDLWRLKIHVRKIREGVQKEGWIERNVLPYVKTPHKSKLRRVKYRAQLFFTDAMNTSTQAARIKEKFPPSKAPPSDDNGNPFLTPEDSDSTISSTINALVTVLETDEGEDDSDPGLNE